MIGRSGATSGCWKVLIRIRTGILCASLIREDDETVYGDAGFIGIEKRPEILSPEILSDEKKSRID